MVAKKKTALTPFHDEAQAEYYAAVIGKRVGPGTAKRLAQLTYDVTRSHCVTGPQAWAVYLVPGRVARAFICPSVNWKGRR